VLRCEPAGGRAVLARGTMPIVAGMRAPHAGHGETWPPRVSVRHCSLAARAARGLGGMRAAHVARDAGPSRWQSAATSTMGAHLRGAEVCQACRQRCACVRCRVDGAMRRAGRRGWCVVPHRLLEKAEGHPSLQPRGGIAVPQRVARSPRRDPTGVEGSPQGVWHTVARQRRGGRRHAGPATAWRRQEPHRMAGRLPGGAERREGLLGQGHRAVCGACATAHVDDHPRTINSGPLQVGAVLHPQATGIERAQAGARARQPHTLEDGVDVLQAEDDRGACALGGASRRAGESMPACAYVRSRT
jgi:hypothetical protein